MIIAAIFPRKTLKSASIVPPPLLPCSRPRSNFFARCTIVAVYRCKEFVHSSAKAAKRLLDAIRSARAFPTVSRGLRMRSVSSL